MISQHQSLDQIRKKKALDNRNWFGSLYYHIIPFNKGSRTYYALLGWDGNNRLSKKKIIEVMAFSGSKIKFGFPIFKQQDNQWYRRVIFEYSAQASMSLKEYPTKKTTLIVFDHLAPSSGALKGHPEHLFPTVALIPMSFPMGSGSSLWIRMQGETSR